MVCVSYKAVFAFMAALAINSADACGVCYAPWHHATVTEDVLKTDLVQISEYFSSFRTFETRMSGLNIIDVAASVGVQISVGVQMNDLTAVDAEIKAVCDGYSKNPSTVQAIWVGNENLQNGNFGTVSATQLVSYIQQVKSCTGGAVPVGTVQRINEWVGAAGAATLSAACDKIGVNIYPFFTPGTSTPIEKLQAQWAQLTAIYDSSKLQLMETGWPTQGEQYESNSPSLEVMQQYLIDFTTWASGKNEAYYFMMYDSTISYSGAEYEKHFGVFTVDGKAKISIPSGTKNSGIVGSSGNQTTTSSTPAPGTITVPIGQLGTAGPGVDPATNLTPTTGSSGTPTGSTPTPASPPASTSLTGDAQTATPGGNPDSNGTPVQQNSTPSTPSTPAPISPSTPSTPSTPAPISPNVSPATQTGKTGKECGM